MRLHAVRIGGLLMIGLSLYALGQSPEPKPEPKSESSAENKGMPPRATPADYPSQTKSGNVTIAAEFLGHSVPRQEGPLSTEDYVVVETAFFGAQGEKLQLSYNDFSLKINGKKNPLPSQPYGLVTKSIKDPEWVPPDQPEKKSKSSFGTGQDSNEPPPPVHVPIELQRGMALHLQHYSLPEGERPLPEAGLLFFPYRGKTQSIRSLELIYSGPAGKATLDLQP